MSKRISVVLAMAMLLIAGIWWSMAQAEGTLEWGEITSPALEGNLLGDTATRPVAVYLPPSYETSEKRYPVIFGIHGTGSNARSTL